MSKDNRWTMRNKRLRKENDYNRVLNEYINLKHNAVGEEFCKFYNELRGKYPDRYFYKGSKNFRGWVISEIEKYDVSRAADEGENVNNTAEAAVLQNTDVEATVSVVDEGVQSAVVGAAVQDLGEIVNNMTEAADQDLGEIVIGSNVVVPPPMENIIANGAPSELEELNALIGDVIADIEGQCDEGIELSPHHELEIDPLHYDAEVEGLDAIDFDFDIQKTPLELELDNYL